MKGFFTIAILIIALISCHLAASWSLPQKLIGFYINPLPVLIMVAAFRCPISTIGALAIFCSFTQDAISSAPVGTSILPLYALGLIVHVNNKNITLARTKSRFTLGAASGAFVSILSLLVLLVAGHEPLIGWFSIWQLLSEILASGFLGLVFFPLAEWIDKSVEEQPLVAPYDTSTRIIRSPHIHG